MLLKRAVLEGIQSGAVDLVFRRWRRPTVKAGGSLKTAVGVLAIKAVDRVTLGAITEREARRAGYGSLAELLTELRGREGTCYRIRVAFDGADPRIALRENPRVSDSEFETLRERLRRFDRASAHGPWTQKTLEQIDRHPHTPARDLAADAGVERAWFKTNVRKLKNLGLTVSHKPGYALSPRGKSVLERLRRSKS